MERVLDIIKRFWPKFYNRITWTVVVAGLALISSPLWEQLISAIISKNFDLTTYIPNEPVYGIILVVSGLAYHLGASIIESINSRTPDLKLQEAGEHDSNIARRFFDQLSEGEVIDQLEMLGSDHSCNDERRKVLWGIQQFGDLTENEFIDSDIQSSFKALHKDIKDLTSCIGFHFFPMKDPSRSCLYPEYNVDRGGMGTPEERAHYNKYAIPLNESVRSAKENYRAFRRTIKAKLSL